MLWLSDCLSGGSMWWPSAEMCLFLSSTLILYQLWRGPAKLDSKEPAVCMYKSVRAQFNNRRLWVYLYSHHVKACHQPKLLLFCGHRDDHATPQWTPDWEHESSNRTADNTLLKFQFPVLNIMSMWAATAWWMTSLDFLLINPFFILLVFIHSTIDYHYYHPSYIWTHCTHTVIQDQQHQHRFVSILLYPQSSLIEVIGSIQCVFCNKCVNAKTVSQSL